ncbi:MAG: tetratricopeptide repeat protein [Asticcacaulis sp.]|nr:tetratricopeptide repeat protein [Asticcacaulis sp.]
MRDHRFGYGVRMKLAAGLTGLALVASLGATLTATFVPASAHAQLFKADDDEDDPNQKPTDSTVWDAKRLQKLDRNVRKLERAVARTENKTTPPILIEPDPEVVALQATVDTLSRKLDEHNGAITQLTAQLEESQHQNQVLQAKLDAVTARIDTLAKRADLSDAHLKDLDAQLAPPPPPPPSTGDAQSDFERAFNLMTTGKIDDATRAFEGFTTTWPEAAQLPEAWFRLGQLRAMKQDNSGAIAAYATALKGWPKTSWAPEATVKLADALADANRPTEACAAVAQFDKLYAKMATTDSKALAKSLKVRAKCPA